MDRSEELEELGDKLRRTLRMAGNSSGAQAGSVRRDDVIRGMSQFGGQRTRQKSTLTMRRPEAPQDLRPAYEEYISPPTLRASSQNYKFYAVAAGRRLGIFDSWPETNKLVWKFPNASFKGFLSWNAAVRWLYGQPPLPRGAPDEDFVPNRAQRIAFNTRFAAESAEDISTDSLVYGPSGRTGNTLFSASTVEGDDAVNKRQSGPRGQAVGAPTFGSDASPISSGEGSQAGILYASVSQTGVRQRSEDASVAQTPNLKARSPTGKSFVSPTASQRRAAGASTVVSPMLMVTPAWAEAMRAMALDEERQEYPALLPWIHEGGRDELRLAGLAQLALPDDEDALSVGLQQMMDEYQATSEELVDAMSTSSMEVLQERRSSLASLIAEVIQSAPDEELDQVEVLQSLAAELLQDNSGTGRQSRLIVEEASTIHYLYHTMTLMRQVNVARDKALHQAEILDQVRNVIWQRGVPSQMVQQLRERESPEVKRAKEAVRYKTRQVIAEAYRTLKATGEELQRIVDGDEGDEDDTDYGDGGEGEGEDDTQEDQSRVSGRSTSSSRRSRGGQTSQTPATSATTSRSPSKSASTAPKSTVAESTSSPAKADVTSKANPKDSSSGEGDGSSSSSDPNEVTGVESRADLATVLKQVRNKGAREMCVALEEGGLVGEVDELVSRLFAAWMATRMTGMREETRVIAQRLIDEPIEWVVHGKMVAGGKHECEIVDFEGKAKSIDCEQLWRQLEDMAQQYSWTVNHMTSYLIQGYALKGQAKTVLLQARQAGDVILCSKSPKMGDIVECLLRYYQVKYRYLMLLGQPTEGAVVNRWVSEVVFDVDSADGRLQRYHDIKKYLLMKSHTRPMELHDELARQAMLPEYKHIGGPWWTAVKLHLRNSETLQIQMGKSWTVSYENIQAAVDARYSQELIEEQTEAVKGDHSRGGRSSKRTPVSNALRSEGSPASARSRSDSGERSYPWEQSSPGRERSYQKGQSSPARGGSPHPYRKEGRSSSGSSTLKSALRSCESCGCQHFEEPGFGICRWRPTNPDGTPRKPEFKGWDPVYHAHKMPKIQKAMWYRMQDAKDGPAKMNPEEQEAFYKKVFDLSRMG
jgi:hypothetical protein